MKELRYCIQCGKRIPNHRQERARTCTKICSHDWNHTTPSKRKIAERIKE